MNRLLVCAAALAIGLGSIGTIIDEFTVSNGSGAYSVATEQSWPDGQVCDCITVWNKDASGGDSIGVEFKQYGASGHEDQVVLSPQADQEGPFAASSCGAAFGLGLVEDVRLDTDDCTDCAETAVLVTCAKARPRP